MNNKDKINAAKHILKIIEGKDDNKTLDEIDARVWCLLASKEFLEIDKADNSSFWYNPRIKARLIRKFHAIPNYSISLDTCQSIMLDGWYVDLVQCHSDQFKAGIYKPNYYPEFYNRQSKMALTWLHAIIQSMIWEWSQKT